MNNEYYAVEVKDKIKRVNEILKDMDSLYKSLFFFGKEVVTLRSKLNDELVQLT